MKRPSMQIALGIVFGAGMGAGTAVLLGTGGAWLAIGIALGIAIGAAMFRKHPEQEHVQRLTTK
jgi:hypothetical protein